MVEPLEKRCLLSAGAWSQVAKLLPSDGTFSDNFGVSVALNGNTALVGSTWGRVNGTNSGSAYLFSVTTGHQLAKLTAADGASGDDFGKSVAISGNIALVGSRWDDDNGTDSGSAYLFDATTGAQIAKLKPADGAAGDNFGWSAALSGNTALVGSFADDDNGDNSGSAYLFDVTSGTQIAKLLPDDGEAGDFFGVSVALSGNLALVGSYGDNDSGDNSGSAYLFNATTGAQIAKLTPIDGAANYNFGWSVALSGDIALVGSPRDGNGLASGSAYLFNASTGQQIAKLLPAEGAAADYFGFSVAVSGNTALVGSMLDDDNGTNSGSAYLFDITGGQQIAKLVSADGATTDYFGNSVALSGNTALVGSMWDDDNGTDSGSAYLFREVALVNLSSAFWFETSQQAVLDFNHDVGASLDAGDLVVTNLDTNTPLPGSAFTTSFDASNNRLTVTFTVPLPDANYRLTIPAGTLQSPLGTPLASDVVLDFFVLAGDANREGVVDAADLQVLSQNYQQTGRTFSQGNFDYSANGLVDIDDLVLLTKNFTPGPAALFEPGAISTPRTTPVTEALRIALPGVPTGLDLSDFELLRFGVPQPLAGASMTMIRDSAVELSGWGAATILPGLYTLRLKTTGWTFGSGQTLAAPADLSFFHYKIGDMNSDGQVNNLDIAPFVQGLTSPSSFATSFGYAPDLLGDVNQDGAFNNLDIAPFVALLTGGRSMAEPTRPPARLASGNPFSGRPLGVLSLPTDDDLLGSSRQTLAGSR